jgi:hypothetical protein
MNNLQAPIRSLPREGTQASEVHEVASSWPMAARREA